MKKYTLLFALLLMLLSATGYAQVHSLPLPVSTHVMPHKLTIGFSTTTVLIFPVAITNGDRGSSEIVVQKEMGVENVLKIKAGKKNFQSTNLHVYTVDGRVYSFVVEYAEAPVQLTYNLNKLESTQLRKSAVLVETSVTPFELQELAKSSREAKPFLSLKSDNEGVQVRLQSIHSAKGVLFFTFLLQNKTSLSYDVDFVRLYVKDKQHSKRSSVQEQALVPSYIDSLHQVRGRSENKVVIALPQFTIPKNKEFRIDLFEKNGGRHLSLQVSNKHLSKTKSILADPREDR